MKTKTLCASLAMVLCLWNAVYASNERGGADTGPEGSYAIYSVFLYNFIKYMQWPDDQSKLVIGVLDHAGATAEIEKMAKAKATTERQILVINTDNESELVNLHMVFVPANRSGHFMKMADKFKGKPIVVVTEDPDLVEKGASISFKVVSNKLRFQMNNSGLKSSGLKVSNALDALAVQ